MEEVKNRFVAIKANIDGAPTESDFEIKSETISLSIIGSEAEMIVKNLYVSVDPYQINRMKSKSSSQSTSDFATAIAPGKVSVMFLSLSHTHNMTRIKIHLLFSHFCFLFSEFLKELLSQLEKIIIK